MSLLYCAIWLNEARTTCQSDKCLAVDANETRTASEMLRDIPTEDNVDDSAGYANDTEIIGLWGKSV